MISILLVLSCGGAGNGEGPEGKSYFTLEGPAELAVSEEGTTQEYTVKSDGAWEVVRKSVQTWAEARPLTGQNDGTFRITVRKNTTGQERSMKFSFLLDGKEQQPEISVVQAADTQGDEDMSTWNEEGRDKNLTFIRLGIPAYDAVNYLYRRDGQDVLKIKFQEPVIAGVAKKPEAWGYFQQPSLYRRASDGLILLTWHYADDNVAGTTPVDADRYRTSTDEGESWQTTTPPPWESMALILKNGEGIAIRTPAAIKISESSLQLPQCLGTTKDAYNRSYSFYRLSELPSELQGVYLTRWAKNYTSYTVTHATLDDPGAVRHADGDYFPVMWWGNMKLLPDNSLVAGIYPMFYELPSGEVDDPSGISFYKSLDNGYSWKILGKVPYVYDPAVDPNGVKRTGFGYIEPAFEVLSNGTFLSVLRTHDGYGHSPQYISRSSNGGANWSEPQPFTPNGVYPRLLQLENGVLVLVSGRPGLQLRFSFDGKGEKWTDPFEMLPYTALEPAEQVTCGYANLLATGPDSFIIAYSDFKYVNHEGQERKAIKTRKITVTKE